MNNKNCESRNPFLDRFPFGIILGRWFFTGCEIGLATYFAFRLNFNLGLLFLSYSVICAFVLLPAIRCVRCYYYGKLCNFGWGIMVSKLFPKALNESQGSKYGYTFLFWPLRIIPFLAGIPIIIEGTWGGFSFIPQGLLAAYVIIIILHRWFYRSMACSRCHEKGECAVYDCRAVLRNIEKTEAVLDNKNSQSARGI